MIVHGVEIGIGLLKFHAGFLNLLYFLLQGVFKPVIYVGVTANVIHAGINALLIKGADFGFQYVYIKNHLAATFIVNLKPDETI